MSNDPYSPDSFRDQNGNHSWQSLTNFGQHAASQGWSSPGIQSTETAREYQIRQEAWQNGQR